MTAALVRCVDLYRWQVAHLPRFGHFTYSVVYQANQERAIAILNQAMVQVPQALAAGILAFNRKTVAPVTIAMLDSFWDNQVEHRRAAAVAAYREQQRTDRVVSIVVALIVWAALYSLLQG